VTAAGRPARRPIGVALKPLLLIVLLLAPVPVIAATPLLQLVAINPRVFDGGSDGVRDNTTITVTLSRPATLTVLITNLGDVTIRTLRKASAAPAGSWSGRWDGRNSDGIVLPDGAYRLRIIVTDGTVTDGRRITITKAKLPIYAPNPAAITIAIDPGHGGGDPGATRNGFTEKAANLDIAMRLKAMIEGAGAKTVMTRTTDRRVNIGNVDWSGDGEVGYRDELASRIEVANQARAAVFVAVHNNSATSTYAYGTTTLYWAKRTFGDQSQLLATLAQGRVYSNLATFRRTGWSALNRGIRSYAFYVLNDWDPIVRPRASLMPGILHEGLYVSNAGDRGVLSTPLGRQRIATGLYEGIARFLEQRSYGATYALTSAPPTTMVEGAAASMKVKVTNTSPRDWPAGYRVGLSFNPWVPYYDGSGRTGTAITSVALPALAQGQSTTVTIPFTAPLRTLLATTNGKGLFHVDVIAGATRLSKRGVVALQLPFTVTSAPTPTPSPTPTPTPSPIPSPSSSPMPSPSPSASPSPPASPSPSAAPSTEPSAAPSTEPSAAPSTEPSSAPPVVPSASAEPSAGP
jgi:N-acetylmuramoyl-L-alanine amidase